MSDLSLSESETPETPGFKTVDLQGSHLFVEISAACDDDQTGAMHTGRDPNRVVDFQWSGDQSEGPKTIPGKKSKKNVNMN